MKCMKSISLIKYNEFSQVSEVHKVHKVHQEKQVEVSQVKFSQVRPWRLGVGPENLLARNGVSVFGWFLGIKIVMVGAF